MRHPTASRLVSAVACGLAVAAGAASGQDQGLPNPLSRALDAAVASVYPPGGPGAVVIVAKDGQVLLRKAYGLANVELQVPMQPDMVLALASLTKQFTAAGILMLAEQGQLARDDDILRYLPGYPARGARITIEHLLTHTAGISALTDMADLRGAISQDAKVTDAIADWTRDQPPDFAPGERWSYLNWGDSLLGAVIERVSGRSYGAFLQQRIFDPLGMAHTFYDDRRRIIPRRVPGYELRNGTALNAPPGRGRVLHPGGAGALLSTVDDLARWNEALYGERMLRRSSIDRMFTPYRLGNGTFTGYGYAWNIGEYGGHRMQEHSGVHV